LRSGVISGTGMTSPMKVAATRREISSGIGSCSGAVAVTGLSEQHCGRIPCGRSYSKEGRYIEREALGTQRAPDLPDHQTGTKKRPYFLVM
jgi:hypothetical protein